MSNKTISINPILFSSSGLKTKRNRDKKVKATVAPLISPNVLKNKLLKRIKEHKNKETQNLENNKSKSKIDSKQNESFSDEFTESINYLQTLTTQKKTNEEKEKYEREKIRRREELERKTIKNRESLHAAPNFVNIDLPEELTQPLIKINTEQLGGNIGGNIGVNDNIPYGILKGGTKPTFRDWSKTQRNQIVTNPNAALTIQCGFSNKGTTDRENRLHNLREKLKQKQLEKQQNDTDNIMMTQNLIQKPIITEPSETTPIQSYTSNEVKDDSKEQIIGIKKIFKKTTKKKYTLGRSKTKNSIGVLIKDRGTRKQVICAQKDLKRKPINDVKTYLRDHNLIKIGSNAPNDIIRKLYESAMLAGEITNSNTEILLHNFSKDDKEF
jgi:hypothetical protein